MGAATLSTEEFARLLGVSPWTLYSAVKTGVPPIAPVRVGRRLLWPRAAAERLLGIEPSDDRLDA